METITISGSCQTLILMAPTKWTQIFLYLQKYLSFRDKSFRYLALILTLILIIFVFKKVYYLRMAQDPHRSFCFKILVFYSSKSMPNSISRWYYYLYSNHIVLLFIGIEWWNASRDMPVNVFVGIFTML